MDANETVTIRVTIEIPRDEHVEDFYVDRAKWEAMTEGEQEKLVDTEFYPVALSNAGIGGSYEVVDTGKADA
jgi:hypothetical protein